MFSSIKSKILTTTIAVIVGFVVLALLIFWAVVHQFAVDEIERDLVGGRQTFERYHAQRQEALMRKAGMLSRVPYLIASLSEEGLDERSAAAALDDVRPAAGKSSVILADAEGRRVAGTSMAFRFGESLHRLPAIERALTGAPASAVWMIDAPCFVALAPVIAGRELVGLLALAEPIDTAFADEMRLVTGRDVLVMLDGKKVAESWQRSGTASKSDDVRALATRLQSSSEQASEVFATELAGEQRMALAIPFGNGRGFLLLSRAEDEILYIAAQSWRWILLAGLVVTALGVLASLSVARRVSDPLRRLMAASDALASGDLHAQVLVESSDEVGKMSESFNGMARQIEKLIRDVQASAIAAGQANRSKDKFLTSVSHELRTPITSIYAYAELLETYGDESASDEMEFVRIIKSESERLSRIVDDILDFVRLDTGEMELIMSDVDVGRLLADVIASQEADLRTRDLLCTVRTPPEPVVVDGDRKRLAQVVGKVLDNARAFSPNRGQILVMVERVEPNIEIRIADQGPGVPDHAKELIFERFHQHGDALTDKPAGTGLGMSYSRQILEAHGGAIRCEDSDDFDGDGGARFVLELPRAAVGTLYRSQAEPERVTTLS